MEIVAPVATGSAGAALIVAAGLHAAWALGVTWPAASSDELADLVVGHRPMPGPVACGAVATALGVAGVAVATAPHTDDGRAGRSIRAATAATVAALAIRATAGVVADASGFGAPSEEFRRWNRVLFNPLCLGLAGLASFGVGRWAR